MSTTKNDETATLIASRLQKIKTSVQKATQETFPLQPLSDPNDPQLSFHLGMELFGQETSILERNMQDKLQTLERDLQDVLDTAKKTRGTTQTTHAPSDLASIEAETSALRVKISFLKHCSIGRASLDNSIHQARLATEPNLLSSVQSLLQAQQAVDQATAVLEQEQHQHAAGKETIASAYHILDTLSNELRQHRLDLVKQATQTWHNCVTWTDSSLQVRSPKQLAVVYKVLETIDDHGDDHSTLRLLMRKFTRTLHASVLLKMITSNHPPGTVLEHVDSGTTSTPCRHLEWDEYGTNNATTNETVKTVSTFWKPTLEVLERILAFVAQHVLLEQSHLCSMVGLRLFGKPSALPLSLNLEALQLENCRLGDDNGLLLEPLVEQLEATCVPNELQTNQLDELQATANELDGVLNPFLQVLAEKELLPQGSSRLTTFTSLFEQKYVDKRQCVLLNRARSLLLTNDYHNTVQVGEHIDRNLKDEALGLKDGMAVFKLHKASISDTAFKLMELCRAIMDEAVSIPVFSADSSLSVLSANLYRTARQVLDLFRAIVPVSHGQEVATVPRTAAVLHNDCVFFAHNCLTLGLEYKDKFPEVPQGDAKGKLLRQTCMFIDMVPLFRDLADHALGDMLSMQSKQLKDLVADRITLMGKALRSSEVLAEWSEAETALAAGLYHLRHLSQTWKPILSYDIWNRSMCHLTDVVLTMFLDQVGQSNAISSSASQFVLGLFRKATKDLEQVLQGDTTGSRVWERFLAVAKFMDMSLSDIQVALSDGVFRSVTAPELSKLVLACFGETPKRQQLLALLSSSASQST